jgi:cation transport regulator ChaB
MPSTIRRSDARAQDIYVKTHDAAVEQYGEGERAHRTAFASLKNEYRKSGDRWVPKSHRGASDPQAAGSRFTHRMTAGGYDVGEAATVRELREEAGELKIKGRSRMTREQLKAAIIATAGRRA